MEKELIRKVTQIECDEKQREYITSEVPRLTSFEFSKNMLDNPPFMEQHMKGFVLAAPRLVYTKELLE